MTALRLFHGCFATVLRLIWVYFDEQPTQCLMEEGDVCLTMHAIPHSGTRNEGTEPRTNMIWRIRAKSRQPGECSILASNPHHDPRHNVISRASSERACRCRVLPRRDDRPPRPVRCPAVFRLLFSAAFRLIGAYFDAAMARRVRIAGQVSRL